MLIDHVWENHLHAVFEDDQLEETECLRLLTFWGRLLDEGHRTELRKGFDDYFISNEKYSGLDLQPLILFDAASDAIGFSTTDRQAWLHGWLQVEDNLAEVGPRQAQWLLDLTRPVVEEVANESAGTAAREIVIDHLAEWLAIDPDWLSHFSTAPLPPGIDDPDQLDEASRERLRDALINGWVADDSYLSLDLSQLRDLNGTAARFGVESGERVAWMGRWVEANENAWSEASPTLTADLLALINQAAPEEQKPIQQAVAQHALERMRADPAWLAEALGSPLPWALSPHLDPTQLAALRDTVSQNPGVLSGLSYPELRRVGSALNATDVRRADWLMQWVLTGDEWASLDLPDAERLLVELDDQSALVDTGPARSRAVSAIGDRLRDDPAFLKQAVSSSFVGDLLPQLDDGQRIGFRRALAEGLAAHPEALGELSLARLTRLNQRAGMLRVPRESQAEWLRDWVLQGERWKVEGPYRLGLVLRDLESYGASEASGGVDMSVARAALIDHIRGRAAAEPGWLDAALRKGYARFVVNVAGSIQQAEGLDDRDRSIERLAPILNAAGVWSPHRVEVIGRRQPTAAAYRSAWYGLYDLNSCGGSPGWGDDGAADHVGELIDDGLLRGKIEPRPATLYLLAWHARGNNELDAWSAFLDERIGASATGSQDRLSWLLGRAYAEQLTADEPSPSRGWPWLERALSEAASDEDRLRLVEVLVLQQATEGRFDEATALLNEWSPRLGGEEANAALLRLQDTIEAMHQLTMSDGVPAASR